jgi:hypothetical protein
MVFNVTDSCLDKASRKTGTRRKASISSLVFPPY